MQPSDSADRGHEELAACASHDLRAPWATVHEAASLLVDGVIGEVNERQRQLLAVILERTEAWLRRVDESVALPRWVAAGCPLRLQEESLAEVVHQAARQVKGLALMRDSIVTVEAASGLPRVMLDRYRIVQAVRSLLAAVLASSPRGSQVQLSVLQGSDTDVHVEVGSARPATSPQEGSAIPVQEPESDGVSVGDAELGVVRAIIEAHGGRLFPPMPAKTTSPYRVTLPRQSGPISRGQRCG